MCYTVDNFCQQGEVVEGIVAVLDTMFQTCSTLHILDHAVDQVIVVGGLDPRGGIGDSSQRAGVVVVVGDGGAVAEGLPGHPALLVVLVGNGAAVAVGEGA